MSPSDWLAERTGLRVPDADLAIFLSLRLGLLKEKVTAGTLSPEAYGRIHEFIRDHNIRVRAYVTGGISAEELEEIDRNQDQLRKTYEDYGLL